jgi:hypothetical protein
MMEVSLIMREDEPILRFGEEAAGARRCGQRSDAIGN